MKSDQRNRAYRYVVVTLLVLIVLGLFVNTLLTVLVRGDLDALTTKRGGSAGLPCPALPTRFVLEEPAGTQKLLESMSVTNVRVTAVRKAPPPSGSGVAAP